MKIKLIIEDKNKLRRVIIPINKDECVPGRELFTEKD